MELDFNGNVVTRDPNEDTVRRTLQQLAVAKESHAILSRDEMTYIQAARGRAKSGFALEYQDGSTSRHYRCTNDRLSLDGIVRAFLLYLHDDDAWRTDFSWERTDLRWCSGGLYFRLTLVLILLVLLVVWLFVR